MITVTTVLSALALTSFVNAHRALHARGSAPITKCNHDFSLTLDDGPWIYTTNASSNLLTEHSLGTFYMNGDNYGCIYDQYNVDTVREVYHAGHQIAHHTWSHPHLDQLSYDQIDYEIMRLDQAFIKILGVKPNILRPPYGAIRGDQVEYIEKKFGKKVVTWDKDSQDSRGKDSREEIIAFYQDLANNIGSSPTQFTLGHDTLFQTGTSILEVAKILTDAGYKLITTASCLGMEPYTFVGQPQQRDSTWNCDGTWTVDMYSESSGSGSTTITTCSPTTYTAAKGDTCDSIASKFRTTSAQVSADNSFLNCNDIWANTPIKITCNSGSGSGSQTTCSPTSYTSAQGDTCDIIASKFRTTSAQILADNGFLNCNDIWANTPIKITCNSGSSSSSQTTCSPTSYTSAQGDTCDSIASKFRTNSAQVLADNGFLNCNDIWANTPIKITCNSGSSSSSQTTCNPTSYTSVQGDTCDSIASKFRTTSSQVSADNSFLNCNDIWVNTPIKITCSSGSGNTNSCSSTYTSKAGDTCASISSKFGVSAAAILTANSFLNCDDIWTNTPICVPPLP